MPCVPTTTTPQAVELADGIPDDVDWLRNSLGAFGNAIVPQVAAAFIEAYRG